MSDTEATDLDGPFLLDAMLGTLAVYLRRGENPAVYGGSESDNVDTTHRGWQAG